ncbi:MAG: CCA tRNA nucleotidyltransferase [Aeropyrum sp.]|nr:CCA tRNA nucleotidyltransferase [Aeropyrum sp.]
MGGDEGRAEKLLEDVKLRLRPSRAQESLLARLYTRVKTILGRCGYLNSTLSGEGFEIELVGSFAKGTILSDKWEIDIFLLMPRPREWIKSRGREILEKCLHYNLPVVFKYSEHPYATVSIMGMEADIVPAPLVESARDAEGVERTPFHTRFIRSVLERRPELADEIRLLKSFMKGIGVYGAESRVGGFSGYLAELLVIRYGGFMEVIEEASRWRPPVAITVSGEDAVWDQREGKAVSPMIFPDPVDPSRNVAAAVTERRLAEFILAAGMFREKPGRRYFHIYQGNPTYKPMPGAMITYRGRFYDAPPDAVWGRSKRIAERLYRGLRARGLPVVSYSFYTDESSIVAIFIHTLSPNAYPLEERVGPEAWDYRGSMRFVVKRLSEKGWVWVGDRGILYGARYRLSSFEDEVQALIKSLPAPEGAEGVEVRICQSTGPCGFREELERMRDPTPRWLRAVLEERQS